MESVLKKSQINIFAFVLLVFVVSLVAPARGQLRRVKIGDKMPEFSLADPNGVEFAYRHNGKRVLVVAFMSASQKQSKHAIADIEKVVKELKAKAEPFDVVSVMIGQVGKEFFDSRKKNSELGIRILLDTKYNLWGTLGVIVTPTVVIGGNDDQGFGA